MKVFTVVGTSGSGKTTTIEAVIAEFRRRGYRVGSVKEIHYEAFAIDPSPTSNTHRHRAAGAELVTARGRYETDLLYPEKLPMKTILRQYKEYDWVVLEGVDDLPVPAVLCSADKPRDNAICASGKLSACAGLPAFHPLENPEGLCDFLEAHVQLFAEDWNGQAAVRFYSRKNRVHFFEGVVFKRVPSSRDARREAEILRQLRDCDVPVPEVIGCRDNLLILEYLPGEPLPDIVQRGGYDPGALAQALCGWFGAFYAAVPPGELRGDVNGRNFLADGDNIVSVDFEECCRGPIARDAGRLAAFLATYHTRDRERQAALAEQFARQFCARFGCDPREVQAEQAAELAAMRERRGQARLSRA